MSGGLRALARLRLTVRCSSDGEVPFSHPKKGALVRRGGRPGAPRALAVPMGPLWSAGPPQTAETIFSCILCGSYVCPSGTADRELAVVIDVSPPRDFFLPPSRRRNPALQFFPD